MMFLISAQKGVIHNPVARGLRVLTSPSTVLIAVRRLLPRKTVLLLLACAGFSRPNGTRFRPAGRLSTISFDV